MEEQEKDNNIRVYGPMSRTEKNHTQEIKEEEENSSAEITSSALEEDVKLFIPDTPSKSSEDSDFHMPVNLSSANQSVSAKTKEDSVKIPEIPSKASYDTEGQDNSIMETRTVQDGSVPELPRKVKKTRRIVEVPFWVKGAFIISIILGFTAVSVYISGAEKDLDYDALAQSFIHKSITTDEEESAEDDSNFGKDTNNNEFVERLPYSVSIKEDRIDTKSSTDNEEETEEEEEEDSYSTGTYTLLYDMKVRDSASTSGEVKKVLSSGFTVTITQISTNSDGSVWGQTSDGYWICIENGSNIYLK